MADRHTQEQRSHNMRRIRSGGTGPELRVRRIAHALGFRFRLHRKDLPGTPDLVFPRHRKAVFVHGCFWHQHPGCRYACLPATRQDYWLPKLARNAERDADVRNALETDGWQVLEIWECQTRDSELVRQLLWHFFNALPPLQPRMPCGGFPAAGSYKSC
ncbi:very short patch repair endonuclease [Mesorhizobium sp.]|uniref:very short patch repair endonuclease n=1 Tax=Mesorhizobium sp. TaxID=1871066 RepID=UPI000FE60C15|nr:very short patch repair endonuclease [Mesorhizobium sp.]RWP73224.1 MAG: DNA mismatch endonuclease Vsr [Mesorhizobium sp.]